MEQMSLDLGEGRMVKGMWVPAGHRRCPGRGREPHILPETDEFFYWNRNGGYARKCYCIDCTKAAAREQYTNPEWRATRYKSIAAYNQIIAESITDGWREDKELIKDRDRRMCYLCGGPIFEGDGAFDHVNPLSKSYDDRSSNVRYVHSSCNKVKRNYTIEELVAFGDVDPGVFERVRLESE